VFEQHAVNKIPFADIDLRISMVLSSLQRSLMYVRKSYGGIGRSDDSKASLFTKRRWRKLKQPSVGRDDLVNWNCVHCY